MKNFLIITVSLTTLFLIGCQTITNSDPAIEIPINDIQDSTGNTQEINGDIQDATGFIIQSFEDCLNSGFPIMESYPRQCNDGTTTYTEDIKEDLTGNILSGTTGNEITTDLENIQETNEQENISSGTNLSILQQKLKAALERRNQESQNNSGIIQSTPTNTPQTSTSGDEQVTEEDIENLENLLENLVEKIEE
ncbi:MAG: hypothetical protein PHR61_05260 [Candidatus Absconditabacteria bacterium]|nr:hypothetical protein [Candidatus Absconditabacteria bacterium]